MARFDFEDILESIKDIMTSHLNTKITAISAEKSDGIVIPQINANAYFEQDLNEKIANFDPFVVYGIEDIEAVVNGPETAEEVFISVCIVLSDNGRNNMSKIMFRYSRAFQEIFKENWQNTGFSNRIEISRFSPVPFNALDDSASYKAIGVIIKTTIAT
jgi:hypothetical protein